MLFFVLAFLSGDIFVQTFSSLPGKAHVISFLLAFILIALNMHKYRFFMLIILGFSSGFAWTYWHASTVLSWQLPRQQEGRPQLITGYIAGIPVSSKLGTRFEFDLLQDTKVAARIRLLWGNPKSAVRVGDQWQFVARMKRIHGTQSPGAFDMEAWALQNGLRAAGYVIAGGKNKWLSHAWYRYTIEQLRQQLQDRLMPVLPLSKTSHWLPALILGERNGIPQEDWQVLRNTGTNHLMAIAGLHIGILAGLSHALTAWLWRRSSRLPLWMPAMRAGACAALITALCYSALAGFSIPTQRACIMLAVFITALLGGRQINSWHAWALAVLCVLLLNPSSVLSESFWLSFGTIALIIYGMSGRLAPRGYWWKWGRVQWVIGLGLIPFSLLYYQQASLISFAANSIAIPWLGFFILPFCLLAAVFIFFIPVLSAFFLSVADKSLGMLWMVLTWLSQRHFSIWEYSFTNYLWLVCVLTGFILLLAPAGMPGRLYSIIWLMPLLFVKPAKPVPGEIRLAVLDVGQGLAAVVQTASHVLVYDAGPKFADSADMGENIVLPYLRSIGAASIDMLVITHGDNDHIGGAAALYKSMSVLSALSSVPEKLPPGAQYCFAGTTWEWDGVRFSFLYPTRDNLHLTNDSSCVLKIDNGAQQILLTGDIEKYAENDLLARVPGQLSASILIAPHHGSKTSGLPAFIAAVHPQYVLYPAGYRNRYHFPHLNVVRAYTKMNARQLTTAETGTIEISLQPGGTSIEARLYRQAHKRYWRDAAV